MVIGSLFSGIGGFDLGLEWAGLGPVRWQVEKDEFCRGILKKHWPSADRKVIDVRRAGKANLAPVDLICGGFPCQDISPAGTKRGIVDGEESRLWFEMQRIIAELAPRFVAIENSSRLASNGLDHVVGGLESCGYVVEGRIIRASDVGATHERKRLFLVAYLDGIGDAPDEGRREKEHEARPLPRRKGADVPDARRKRTTSRDRPETGSDARTHDPPPGARSDTNGVVVRDAKQRKSRRRTNGIPDEGIAESRDDGACSRRMAQPDMVRRLHGLPDRLDRWPARFGDAPFVWEPERVTVKDSPTRRDRIHALGNAVVPACAFEVGLRIREIDAHLRKRAAVPLPSAEGLAESEGS